jgi:hypothetical protein
MVGLLSCHRGKERSGWPWKKKRASVVPLSGECRDTKKSGQCPEKNSQRDAVREGREEDRFS